MSGARSRLPDRRPAIGFDFLHRGTRFNGHAGYYGDGRVGELFLSCTKVGVDVDADARDSALLFSLLVQHGVPIETIYAALTKGADGKPAGVLGHALDRLAELDRKEHAR